MKPKLTDLWRWSGPLERGTYFFWGVLLAVIKFNLDRILAYMWWGEGWTVFDWSTLRVYLWQSPLTETERPYFLMLLVISLPFLWAGLVLTLRRLRSLHWRPFWVLLFFVPVVKLIFFLVLCLLRSTEEKGTPPLIENSWDKVMEKIIPRGRFTSALMAVMVTAMLAVLAAWLGTEMFRDYGWSIFVGLPFCMGFLSALIHSFHEERSLKHCIAVANTTVLIVGGALVLFAFEGIICLIMAAPIAFAVATIGGMMGFAVQKTFWWRKDSPKLFCSVVLLMPLLMGLEHVAPPMLTMLQVKSSVIINASPEKVWQNVVSFSELPPPTEMIFKFGVAYPMRAEIRGQGVGAIRCCNFSTGPFVEPIEVWDEPRLLKFSVTENPAPMQEWTPYQHVHPPHLDGYLESRGGQFRLVPLADGRTMLEGTTWYYHHMWPAIYWQMWSDKIIHTIHLRVLNHVKKLSERNVP